MKSIEEAIKSLSRVAFSDEQKTRSTIVQDAAVQFLWVLFNNAKPSPELTFAVRALEECIMWHSKAIAAENK